MKNLCWSLVLSLCSLAISIIMIVIYIFKANEFSYADPVTYLSAVLGMIALFVAVGLGYQIYNAVDLKSQINNVKKDVEMNIQDVKTSIKKAEDDLEILRLKTAAEITIAIGDQFVVSRSYIKGFNAYLKLITIYLNLYEINEEKIYLKEIAECNKNATGCLYSIVEKLQCSEGIYYDGYNRPVVYDDIENLIDEKKKYNIIIIEDVNYNEIRIQYEELMNVFNKVFDCIKHRKIPSCDFVKEVFKSVYFYQSC